MLVLWSVMASAATLDVSLDCAKYTFRGGFLEDQQCSIDYANPTGADVADVEFRLRFVTVNQTGISDNLAGGVPGLGSTSQSWRMIAGVFAVAGSPTPQNDLVNQVTAFAVPSVPSGLTSELYFVERTTGVFPSGTYDWVLETWIGGSLDSQATYPVVFDAYEANTIAVLPPTIDPLHHLEGAALVDPGTASSTDAKVAVYLPYVQGSTGAVVADDAFDALSDTPVFDPQTLTADLFWRLYGVPTDYQQMPAALAPDGTATCLGPRPARTPTS
jgi:hypothetical protein